MDDTNSSNDETFLPAFDGAAMEAMHERALQAVLEAHGGEAPEWMLSGDGENQQVGEGQEEEEQEQEAAIEPSVTVTIGAAPVSTAPRPTEDVDDLICDAQDRFFEGDYDESVRLCRRALELAPRDNDAHQQLCLSLFYSHQYAHTHSACEAWVKSIGRRVGAPGTLLLMRAESAYLSSQADALVRAAHAVRDSCLHLRNEDAPELRARRYTLALVAALCADAGRPLSDDDRAELSQDASEAETEANANEFGSNPQAELERLRALVCYERVAASGGYTTGDDDNVHLSELRELSTSDLAHDSSALMLYSLLLIDAQRYVDARELLEERRATTEGEASYDALRALVASDSGPEDDLTPRFQSRLHTIHALVRQRLLATRES